MNALAGLMNPAAIGQSVTNAFQQGVEVRKTRETDNALAQYALNPSADTAAQVARFDPRTGIQLGEYERKRAADAEKTQRAAMTQQLAGRAAQGDKKALLRLWGVDWETASKLDKFQTDKAIEGMEFMANAAYQIAELPPEQQAIAADQFIDQGVALGFDGLAQYKGQVTPQMLQAFVAKAGEMKPFMEFQRPSYQAVPYESTLVNTRDPAAVQAFLGGGTGPGAAPQVKQIGGKSYFQDANGDWYEDDGGATQGGSPTFREAFGN